MTNIENLEKIEIEPGQYVWFEVNSDFKKGDLVIDIVDKTIEKLEDDWSLTKDNHKIIAASQSLKIEGVTQIN